MTGENAINSLVYDFSVSGDVSRRRSLLSSHNVSNGSLGYVSVFRKLKKLRSLFLDSNKLPELLEDESFIGLDSITVLDVSRNNISLFVENVTTTGQRRLLSGSTSTAFQWSPTLEELSLRGK